MTDSPYTDAHEAHLLEVLQRLRENFTSSESEHAREGLTLLDEFESEWRTGSLSKDEEALHSALGHVDQTLHQAIQQDRDEDLFHRTMHALEATLVELETTLPVAARLLKRMMGLISNIGI